MEAPGARAKGHRLRPGWSPLAQTSDVTWQAGIRGQQSFLPKPTPGWASTSDGRVGARPCVCSRATARLPQVWMLRKSRPAPAPAPAGCPPSNKPVSWERRCLDTPNLQMQAPGGTESPPQSLWLGSLRPSPVPSCKTRRTPASARYAKSDSPCWPQQSRRGCGHPVLCWGQRNARSVQKETPVQESGGTPVRLNSSARRAGSWSFTAQRGKQTLGGDSDTARWQQSQGQSAGLGSFCCSELPPTSGQERAA